MKVRREPLASKGQRIEEWTVESLRDNATTTRAAGVEISPIDSDEPPIVLISGMHGDEWIGVDALMRLRALLRGRRVLRPIVLIPTSNQAAVLDHARESACWPGDLNRRFDGHPVEESESSHKLASLLWEEWFSRCSFLLDIHSGGNHRLLPHARLFGVAYDKVATQLATLPIDFAVEWDSWPDGVLIAELAKRGTPAFAVEFGTGHDLDRDLSLAVAHGLVELLKSLGAIDSTNQENGPTASTPRAKRGETVSAPADGLFDPALDPGDHVESGQTLGTFRAFRSFQSVPAISPTRGRVMSVLKCGPARAGETLIETVTLV